MVLEIIREGLKKVLENVIVMAVGGGYCQATPWTWCSAPVFSSKEALLGDTSTNASGDGQGLSWFLCEETMDEQARTVWPGNMVMEKVYVCVREDWRGEGYTEGY